MPERSDLSGHKIPPHPTKQYGPACTAAGSSRTDSAAGFDEQLALRDLLDRLLPERRLAFVATQVLGLSYQEAAQVCGCPVGTIRSRVARAREDLVAAMRGRSAAPAGGRWSAGEWIGDTQSPGRVDTPGSSSVA